MGRNRLPTNVLLLRDSFKKHPERRREDPPTEAGLGDAPDFFDKSEAAIWEEIKAQAMPGVLCRSDRLCIEMLVPLIVRMRNREPLKAAERVFMLNVLSKIGNTPADRSRVASEPKQQLDLGFDGWDQGA